MDNSFQCLLCSTNTTLVSNADLPICSPCLQKQATHLEIYQNQLEEEYRKDPSKLEYVCEIDEILPNKLYLGNYETANNKELLKQKQVSHILVCGEFLKCRFPGEFEYKVIPIQDSLKQGILEYLEESYNFIENGKSVYVHCAAGINRSPAIVCGYLMKKMKWNYDQAFEFVKERRGKANRQSNFAEQLQKYEY